MREPGLAKGAIVLTLFCLLVAITALVVKADPVPPTVSLLNPRAGGIVSGPFKVQVQAWDAAAEVTAVAVSGTALSMALRAEITSPSITGVINTT